jgi:AcrR family transcriptional regulator
VSRTANPDRPDELIDRIVPYLVAHGIADLSLRPLAKAIGSSPRVLLYYFGSSEKMIDRVLARLRERQHALYHQLSPAGAANAPARKKADPAKAYFAIWKHMTSRASEPHFRLFFEIYGLALRHPRRYRAFLRSTIDDWLDFMDDAAMRKRYGRTTSRAIATVAMAAYRGFLLDYCASHDTARLDRAVKLWIQALVALEAHPHHRSNRRQKR